MRFQHPETGTIETNSAPWLWSLLFGAFYYAYKGTWGHAGLYMLAALCSGMLSHLVYPFFAARIIRSAYLNAGWIEIAGDAPSAAATVKATWTAANTPSPHTARQRLAAWLNAPVGTR